MPIVTTTRRDALHIEDPFFTSPVVMLLPDTDVTSVTKGAIASEYVFQAVKDWVGVTSHNNVTNISGSELSHELPSIIADELREYTELNDEDVPNEYGVLDLVDKRLPPNDETGFYDDTYTPAEVINMTRLLLQTIFDELSTYQTHMSVDAPVDQQPWNEGKTTIYSGGTGRDLEATIEPIDVATLHSSYFETPVVTPTPEMECMTIKQACKVTERVFTQITTELNVGRDEEFDGVETTTFRDALQDTLNEYVETDLADMGYRDIDSEITAAVTSTLPTARECESFPDMINAPGVIIHITRMTLQTIFDELSDKQTPFSVDNPFIVSEDKWGETIINEVVTPQKGMPETDPDDGSWEEFDFENANIGDTVRISTIEDEQFTVTDIGFNKRIPVRDGDDITATEYLSIEPIDENNAEPRYIIKNSGGVTSARLIGENRTASNSITGELFLTVERLTTQDPLVTTDIKTKDRLTGQ